MLRNLLLSTTALLLCACSGLQVQRDLNHAAESQRYRSSLAGAQPFNPSAQCTGKPALNNWKSYKFTASTIPVKLPSGISASAVCLPVPGGARTLEIRSDATGGMTYYESTVLHPSLQFLDAEHALIRDIPVPRLRVGDSFSSGMRLTGTMALASGLESARYLVIYVHPDSLDSSTEVFIPGATIPIPYSSAGTVEVRFRR